MNKGYPDDKETPKTLYRLQEVDSFVKKAGKVIFCLNRRFTNRDYMRFGCAYLEALEYTVEAWNIEPDRYERVEIPQGYYQGSNLRELSFRKIRKEIAKNGRETIYILLDDVSQDMLFHLKKHKCAAIVYRSAGSLEYNLAAIPKQNSLKAPGRISKMIISEWKKLIRQYAMPGYGTLAGDYYILNTHYCPIALPSTVRDKIFYIHTGDYDRYLEAKREGVSVSEEIILYIDSGYGLVDIDSMIFGYRDPWRENPEEHCKRRNRIFEKLEDYYKMPVVIAGHPHTDYSKADFGGRDIVFDQTCELTARAKFVILQWSTAISYAMLFEKPVMVLTDDNLIHLEGYHRRIYANYKMFHLKVLNMDVENCREKPWEYVNVIEDGMRRKYIHAYIKEKGTPEMFSYEKLEQIIQKICRERG